MIICLWIIVEFLSEFVEPPPTRWAHFWIGPFFVQLMTDKYYVDVFMPGGAILVLLSIARQ
jgi:hypothetical protein